MKNKIYKKYAKKTATELEGQQFKKGLKWDGKAIAEKIPTPNSFSSARNKGKRPHVYRMEDLDLDGIHLRVLKEHKHEIAELLAKVCSCHYEETLCLVRRPLPVSLPSTKTT